jgi:N-acetylglucosaminyl-diphospho-decaprenol L-rhamnosyltransferase
MEYVSVIIVNHNTAGLLMQCLSRVLESRIDHPIEIYVVDNASTDNSLMLVKSSFPTVKTISSARNLGFAGGNNLALQEILATVPGDVDRTQRSVLLLNSDCFVEMDTIRLTSSFLDEHPEAGAVGPKLVLRTGELDLACRRSFPTPKSAFYKLTGLARRFPNSPRFARYNLTFLDPNKVAEVDSVVGAYMHVRLAAIDDAGLLDESFFMYGEDLDWAFRIKEHGWKVFYYPKAHALHYKGASSSRRSYRLIVEFYRAMYLFHRKHYAPQTFALINWLVAAGIFLRACVALGLNLFRPAAEKRVA